MTSVFRSASAFTSRRRVRPVVERATFVVVSSGNVRYAFPVHSVERVLRYTFSASSSITYGPQTLVLHDLSRLLSPGTTSPMHSFAPSARVLVLHHPLRAGAFVAVTVDEVHEVSAIETAHIASAGDQPEGPAQAAVRARFTHAERDVWVLDPSRLVWEVA